MCTGVHFTHSLGCLMIPDASKEHAIQQQAVQHAFGDKKSGSLSSEFDLLGGIVRNLS